MRAQATISHKTAHRLRLHIPHYKRNSGYFARLRDELSKCAGVEYVKANPQTASVLIQHRSTAEEIGRFAEEMRLFSLAVERTPCDATSLATRVNRRVSNLNATLTTLTKGSLDLPSASALGLVALGLFQTVLRGKLLPSGANLFWWAASLLAREYQTNTLAQASRMPAGRERRRQPPRRSTKPVRG